MTASEVEWVLDTLQGSLLGYGSQTYGASTYGSEYTLKHGNPVALKYVDRDNSQVYDSGEDIDLAQPMKQLKGDLKRGCFIGARSAAGEESPIGTEYDLDVQRVVGLRVVGMHYRETGHVDPNGEHGIPFEDLKRRIRMTLYDHREWPDAGQYNMSFTDLQLANATPLSSNWRDFFRWDVDVIFNGFEDL